MEKIKLAYSSEKSIATITFNDGKGNILDHIMMEEIQTILNSFFDNKDLKLIIFEGEGKHFSFGASVEEHQQEFAAAMLKGFHQLFYTLRDLSIPTLAKVSGQCLGGGMELALMCNFIFADQSANDPLNYPNSGGLMLNNPSNVNTNVEYDPTSGNFNIDQKMGGANYRPPTYMDSEEYQNYIFKKQLDT